MALNKLFPRTGTVVPRRLVTVGRPARLVAESQYADMEPAYGWRHGRRVVDYYTLVATKFDEMDTKSRRPLIHHRDNLGFRRWRLSPTQNRRWENSHVDRIDTGMGPRTAALRAARCACRKERSVLGASEFSRVIVVPPQNQRFAAAVAGIHHKFVNANGSGEEH